MKSVQTKKIKLIYVVASLKRCGPIQQLLGIVSHLNNDFDVTIVTLKKEPIESYSDEFIKSHIKMMKLNYNNDIECIFSKKHIVNQIANLNPDIIHSSGLISDYINTKVKCKVNHVTTIRNDIYFESNSNYGVIKGFFVMKIWEKLFCKIDYPICCSNSLKKTYEKKLKNKKICCIKNGVDVNKYNLKTDLKNVFELKDTLKIKEDDTVFISTGLLNDRKNPIQLIECFKKSCRDDIKLILIGDGNLYEECLNRSKGTDNILVLGYKKNVSEYLKISDIYVSTSKSEGLPNSVLEAGCTGLKLILSNISQHKEIGNNDLYFQFFELKDDEKLVNAINKSKKTSINEKKEIFEYFKNNFSNVKTSKEYSELYKRMVVK